MLLYPAGKSLISHQKTFRLYSSVRDLYIYFVGIGETQLYGYWIGMKNKETRIILNLNLKPFQHTNSDDRILFRNGVVQHVRVFAQ